jgi:hypothetical protein
MKPASSGPLATAALAALLLASLATSTPAQPAWIRPPVLTNRSEHAMAFDSARGRIVLFGGVDSLGALSDTWEWDGTRWAHRAPNASPPAREGPALVYDSNRGVVVLFGGTGPNGALADTWEWNGTDWVERHPVHRARTVCFGGTTTPTTDTSEWDGSRWIVHAPDTLPPRRTGQVLAYAAGRRRVLLFGGFTGTSPLGDTWEWDGTGWTQRTPGTSPSPRADHAMAYDSARDRVVLFGGGTPSGLSDTWEWDGTNWLQRSPARSPSARRVHAMAYDSARGRTVLFGGIALGALDDTWEWDGSDWLQRTPATRPSTRYGHAMAYDAARGRTVVFGGYSLGPWRSDVWEWDGSEWSQRTPAPGPADRIHAALAWDARRGRMVLFGGATSAGGPVADLWELATPCDPAGPGQPGGGALPIACGGTPRVGTPFCVGFTNPSPAPAGFNLLMAAAGPPTRPPFTLQPPGVCSPAWLHLVPRIVLSGFGNPAIFCFALPADPAVAGASVTLQGASLELGVCFRATDALVITVQP